MLDVKEAARKAAEYFAALYANKKVDDVQLEEVEVSDDGKYWLITLSYPLFSSSAIPVVNLMSQRNYKVFTIDAETGEVKSMKIRKVA